MSLSSRMTPYNPSYETCERTCAEGPTLWPEQMGPLAHRNLECTFDISFYGEDED